MIITALRTYLVSKSTITSVVGANGVYPVRIPQGKALPAITLERTAAEHEQDLDGSAGFVRSVVRVELWGEAYDPLEALGEALRLVLDGYHAAMGSVTVAEVKLISESDDFIQLDNAKPTGIYNISQDYAINYIVTKPSY